MSNSADRQRLLADVLAEAEQAGFRERLLDETLCLARQRLRIRCLLRTSAALAAVGVLGLAAWRLAAPHPSAARPQAAGFESVHTMPMPAGAVVRTRPLAAGCFTTTIAYTDAVHTTPTSGRFGSIDDAELLALLGPQPAALVRSGPRSERLFLVGAGDEDSLPLN